mmetsp:Transcript_68976/g.165531  ORF Transcript_68976/g.165531 Transcript_68976/m.165531 type:complete len:342 (-) Transcript_68976:70-1095(-)
MVITRAPSERQIGQNASAAAAAFQHAVEEKKKKELADKRADVEKELAKGDDWVEPVWEMMFGVIQEAPTEKKDPEFSEQYNFLKQVPKAWFVKDFLRPLYPSIISDDPDYLKALFKNDEKIHLKLMEFVFTLSMNHPYGPKLHAEWIATYTPRLERQGHMAKQLQFTKEGEVLWESCGCYKLLPEFVSGPETVANMHRYESIKIANFVVPLGAYSSVITVEYSIKDNWSAERATIVDADGRGGIGCKDFFVKEPGFAEFMTALFDFVPEPKKRKGEKTEEENGGRRVARKYYRVEDGPPAAPAAASSTASPDAVSPVCTPPPQPSGRRRAAAKSTAKVLSR